MLLMGLQAIYLLVAGSTMPCFVQMFRTHVLSLGTLWTLCRLYKGIQPLWGRQIPYTMMKFGESSDF